MNESHYIPPGPKHPEYVARGLLHYYFTPREMDGRSGKGPGTHEHDSALCGNGSFHFARTKDKKKVTCPDCIARFQNI